MVRYGKLVKYSYSMVEQGRAMKNLLLLLPLLLTPAHASVYAVQQPNGSWRVSRYNDGDATVKVTSRVLRKTIKVDKKITKKDRSNKIYTKAGWKKFDEYEQADEAWKKADARVGATFENSIQVDRPNNVVWCGSGGCNFPKPGTWDRPAKPQFKEGVDFNYGMKTVTEKVDAPNPDHLMLTEPEITFSDRAKNPGAMWLVGTTVTMSDAEFNRYWDYLH